MKHFSDDKDRHGVRRALTEPDREGIRLRGWTPTREDDGRVSWTSPSGRYCPPESRTEQGPAYPRWLKDYVEAMMVIESFTEAVTVGDGTGINAVNGIGVTEAELYASDEDDDRDDEGFDPDNLPEPPEDFLIDFEKEGWQEITNTTPGYLFLE